MLFICTAAMAQQKPRIFIKLNDKEVDKSKKSEVAEAYEEIEIRIKQQIKDKYVIIDRSESTQEMIRAEHEFEKSGLVSPSKTKKEFGEQEGISFLCGISIKWLKGDYTYRVTMGLYDIGTGRDVWPTVAYSPLRILSEKQFVADTLAKELIAALAAKRVSGISSGTSSSAANTAQANSSDHKEEEARKLEETQKKDTFTDSRDGKKYRTVKIGEQVWMAENLNYNASGSKCYDNKTQNCDTYGRLYDWNTARNKNVCPSSWHLPSIAEWNKLFHFADGSTGTETIYRSKTANKYLKAKSGWDYNYYDDGGVPCNGEDRFGFSALPGGYGDTFVNTYFSKVGKTGYWWSSNCKDWWCNCSWKDESLGESQYIYGNDVMGVGSYSKNLLYSVRCVRD
jgi:uncharacterized protein (TIGR02145 family)